MRNTICQSIHSSLQQEDFIQVMTPIITSNDCEGAGEMFSYHCLVNLIQSCRRQNRFSILLQYFGLSNRIRAITSRNDGRSYDSSIYVWTSFSSREFKYNQTSMRVLDGRTGSWLSMSFRLWLQIYSQSVRKISHSYPNVLTRSYPISYLLYRIRIIIVI